MDIYKMNLRQFFKDNEVSNPPIPVIMMDRFEMFEHALAGLTHIQQNGYFHLDIKLSNILINTDVSGNWDRKTLVITDFGIGGTDLTTLGKAGTPGFASPEQLLGKVHPKSDNFGLGRIMPFIFAKWDTAWNIIFHPITNNEYETLFESLLSKKSAEYSLIEIIQNLTQVSLLLQIIGSKIRPDLEHCLRISKENFSGKIVNL